MRIEESLAQLRRQTHARRRELALVEAAFVAALTTGEVERHGVISDQEHLGGGGSRELNERILAGQRVCAFRSDDGIGDAVHAGHRNQGRLRVERLGGMHVRHNLVAQFDEIVGHGFGGDFREAEARLRIDQPRIDGHAGYVNDLRGARDIDGTRRTDCSDLPALHGDHAVLNDAVGDGQQLAAFY